MKTTLLRRIADILASERWLEDKGYPRGWERALRDAEEGLPSGSGFDVPITVDRDESTDRKIVLTGSFHVMNGHGYYTGWRDFRIVVRPAFEGCSVRVFGRMTKNLRDCIGDSIHAALSAEYSV